MRGKILHQILHERLHGSQIVFFLLEFVNVGSHGLVHIRCDLRLVQFVTFVVISHADVLSFKLGDFQFVRFLKIKQNLLVLYFKV